MRQSASVAGVRHRVHRRSVRRAFDQTGSRLGYSPTECLCAPDYGRRGVVEAKGHRDGLFEAARPRGSEPNQSCGGPRNSLLVETDALHGGTVASRRPESRNVGNGSGEITALSATNVVAAGRPPFDPNYTCNPQIGQVEQAFTSNAGPPRRVAFAPSVADSKSAPQTAAS